MKYINVTDDEIKPKINNIRFTLARLENIVPKKHKIYLEWTLQKSHNNTQMKDLYLTYGNSKCLR